MSQFPTVILHTNSQVFSLTMKNALYHLLGGSVHSAQQFARSVGGSPMKRQCTTGY